MSARFVLYQHLTVRTVTRSGCDVQVVVADPSGASSAVQWSFDDIREAQSKVRTLNRWRRLATRLTFIRGNGESALVDDAQLFQSAYGYAGDAVGLDGSRSG